MSNLLTILLQSQLSQKINMLKKYSGSIVQTVIMLLCIYYTLKIIMILVGVSNEDMHRAKLYGIRLFIGIILWFVVKFALILL